MSFYKVSKLINAKRDAKTIKGLKLGVLTGIMYLAPHDVSGYQTCPKASAGCRKACLFTAGYASVYEKVNEGRVNKTKWFFEERQTFLAQLVKNVQSIARKAERENLIPAVRLNGTSDISWEKYKVVKDGVEYPNIMTAFPDVQFYDYTKVLGRKKALALPNYHLTFSLSESNDSDALKALKQGYNVAVVMQRKKSDPLPATWSGFPVVDGDDTDVRFQDPKGGHIVALTAKGDARKDKSGFVRSVNAGFKAIDLKMVA